jgi:hypothetical protein
LLGVDQLCCESYKKTLFAEGYFHLDRAITSFRGKAPELVIDTSSSVPSTEDDLNGVVAVDHARTKGFL